MFLCSLARLIHVIVMEIDTRTLISVNNIATNIHTEPEWYYLLGVARH